MADVHFPCERISQEEPLHVVRAFLRAILKAGSTVPVAAAAIEEPLVLLEQAIGPPLGWLPLLSDVCSLLPVELLVHASVYQFQPAEG